MITRENCATAAGALEGVVEAEVAAGRGKMVGAIQQVAFARRQLTKELTKSTLPELVSGRKMAGESRQEKPVVPKLTKTEGGARKDPTVTARTAGMNDPTTIEEPTV